jgi:N-acetylmuramate 1-kinase
VGDEPGGSVIAFDRVVFERVVDEAGLQALARELAVLLRVGDVLALDGDLGAGKTTFARALIRSLLNDPTHEVPSPTFAIQQCYEGAFEIVHYDLYRLSTPSELDELDYQRTLEDALVLIEWPERASVLLPIDHLRLRLESIAGRPDLRRVTMTAPDTMVARFDRLLAQPPTP